MVLPGSSKQVTEEAEQKTSPICIAYANMPLASQSEAAIFINGVMSGEWAPSFCRSRVPEWVADERLEH